MFCHNCGAKLDDGAKFCNKCGTKLDGTDTRQSLNQNTQKFHTQGGNFPEKFISLFQKYFIDILKEKYAKFDGRATRAEYWYFILFQLLISLGVYIILSILFRHPEMTFYILSLALLVPTLAIGVRRLHDINLSGWFILLGLIPILGLALIVLFVLPSKEYSKY